MKTFKTLIISLFLILISISCKDVLDLAPLNKINASQVFTDPVLANASVANLYSRIPWNDFMNQQSIQSDESTGSTGNASNVTQGTVNNSSEANAQWDYAYIRDMTNFITQIGASTLDASIKKQLGGEVRFLRALVYFEMEKRYGGVPLVDIVIDPFQPIDEKYVVRSTEEQIVDFINSELDQITPLLTATSTPLGRVNKWTAFALKARASLWAASISKYGTVQLNGLVGVPSTRTNELFKRASDAADSVILSGKYSLYNPVPSDRSESYRRIFIDEENSEVIFEHAYDGVNIGHGWDCWMAPTQFVQRGDTWDPMLEFLMGYENADGSTDDPQFGTTNLYNDGRGPFAKKDPRLFGTVFFEKDAWSGGIIKTYEGIDTSSTTPNVNKIVSNNNLNYNGRPTVGSDSRTGTKDDVSTNSGFIIKKYIDPRNTFIADGASITNWIVFRLAEMYLTKAEAQFELGNLTPAITALNMTRARAGISLVNTSTITQNKVRTERRSELAFENLRYWDLRRWRTASTVLNFHFGGLRIIYFDKAGKYYFLPIFCESFTRAYSAAMDYNPITVARLNNNPKLIENPHY